MLAHFRATAAHYFCRLPKKSQFCNTKPAGRQSPPWFYIYIITTFEYDKSRIRT